MNDTILCPHCNKSMPLTQAIAHQLDQSLKEQQKGLEEERERLRHTAQKWKEDQLQKFEEEKRQQEKILSEQLRVKISKELELKLVDSTNALEEMEKKREQLQEQLLETNKLNRQLKTQNEEKQLELEKKLVEGQARIRLEEQKKIEESYHLRFAEQDKKLSDALKIADEYKRKLEQGSQQLQGEVLELELEQTLRREFPYDEIKAVAKGIRGGDIIQTVRNSSGRSCGTIIWEFKRTKAWSSEWIQKLKEDQRSAKADLAIIITNVLPQNIEHFGSIDSIWVGLPTAVLGLATALRQQLLEVSLLKASMDGKQGKMEILYNYIYSIEFRHRIQAILETYTILQEDLEKEKRMFTAKWAKQEKNLRRVIDTTLGMSGDLESITGKEILEETQIQELPEEISEEKTLF